MVAWRTSLTFAQSCAQLTISIMMVISTLLCLLSRCLLAKAVSWGVFVKNSECTGNPGVTTPLSEIPDANGCNGGKDRGGGNLNSFQVINCSSKCICANQVAGTDTCVGNIIGSNIKESCLDTCAGDCNGKDCQKGQDACIGDGCMFGHTFLKLVDGPIACATILSDEEYQCHTTGMDPSYVSPHKATSGGSSDSTPSGPTEVPALTQASNANRCMRKDVLILFTAVSLFAACFL